MIKYYFYSCFGAYPFPYTNANSHIQRSPLGIPVSCIIMADTPNPPVLRQSASVVGMSERQRVE